MKIVLPLAIAMPLLTACQPTSESNQPDAALTNAAAETASEIPMDQSPDANRWLEDVEGERALKWVREQNERSLARLQADPLFKNNYDKALDLATSAERIPYGVIRDGLVYNFWQDDVHVRGLWRRTTLESYESRSPEWEAVLDIDELAATEDKNWVYKGAECFRPKDSEQSLCLLSLSDGGKDAIVLREFDLARKQFVEAGFVTPEAKQGAVWVDENTVAIATDWGGDGSTLTQSGYPSSVRLWRRGVLLEEAEPLFTGDVTDVGVWPWAGELDDGRMIYGAVEADTFFTFSNWLLSNDDGPVKIPVPPKATLGDNYDGYLFVTLQQDWDIASQAQSFKTGDLVAFDLDAFLSSETLPEVELVFRANERQAVNGVAVAKGAALLSINDNVISKILRLARSEGGWTTQPIDLPGTGQASVAFSNKKSEVVFLNYEGFLTPDSLLKLDTKTNSTVALKSLPQKFDATGLTVSQREAVSKDGTRVPYFMIHREDIEYNATTPTLLYGYGGFEISLRPSYSGNVGRLWLEKGGAYVVANIRGGGEFGPAWHQAGLKTNRQRIYDDFIAVGEDLIERRVTAPRHLGIMGGSNGGLLMGVMITQRPDLWNGVVIQVPLLDMLRYHKLLAGASWVDEYGDPDVADERAFLEAISPYHNFDAAKDYPMPFFVTSTKDDRVHPGHARKMARLFQAAEKPFLYYENIDGGHSAAANQKERAKRSALEFTYLTERLFEPAE